ncbi:kinase-like domain-containing protein [Ganoderma leucocontextum]|nr:kinase-like domain-containing protein [Ganoderma leucocontextum]
MIKPVSRLLGFYLDPSSRIKPSTKERRMGRSLDTILAVFRGSFEGRAVAVKRSLHTFVALFSHEVNIVQASSSHPNVMQYYHHELKPNFLYIAFERCLASLITAGLHHLHTLNIIHRDVKPHNVLISHAGENAGFRMLISDYAMCKKFDASMAAHTLGWRTPEVIRGKLKFDDADVESQSPTGRIGMGDSRAGTPTGKPTRLTKAVDIFPLGCLYYYVLPQGLLHPFGTFSCGS